MQFEMENAAEIYVKTLQCNNFLYFILVLYLDSIFNLQLANASPNYKWHLTGEMQLDVTLFLILRQQQLQYLNITSPKILK